MKSIPTETGVQGSLERDSAAEQSDTYVVCFEKMRPSTGGKMTEQDWDKFEKDIEDAFEQVP